MSQVVAEWDLLEVSFSTFYGIELEDAYRTRSWRWFRVKIRGLLQNDTPLMRHFMPDTEPAPEEPTD